MACKGEELQEEEQDEDRGNDEVVMGSINESSGGNSKAARIPMRQIGQRVDGMSDGKGGG